MKKEILSVVSHAIFGLSLLLLSSCVNQIADETATLPQGEPTTLNITTRSVAADGLTYPILLYAFDAQGNCASSKKLESGADTDTEMTLPAGQYTLVALSDTEGYSIPTSPKKDDLITLSDGIPSTGALKMISTQIDVEQSQNVTLELAAPVSQVKLTLTDVPADVTEVRAQFNNLYSGISFGNNYASTGNTSGKVSLQKENASNTWSTPTPFHFFPSQLNSFISLSITFIKGSETPSTYAYNSTNQSFIANTPYELTGEYSEAYGISSTLSSKDWEDTKVISFGFGSGAGQGGDTNGTGGNSGENNTGGSDAGEGSTAEQTFECDTIPISGGIWGEHFVAVSEIADDRNSTKLTLLSIKEGYQITPNVVDSTDPEAASKFVTNYKEDNDIKNWRIPTESEAIKIRNIIGGTGIILGKTNHILYGIGSEKLSTSTNVSYLCENGTKSLKWYNQEATTDCEKGIKYYLRLISTVTVTKKQQ